MATPFLLASATAVLAGASPPNAPATAAGPPAAGAPEPAAGGGPEVPSRAEARRILTPPKGSLSLGTTNSGVLAGAVAIPLQGPGWRALDVVPGRGTNFGTREMLEVLRRTAARVRERHPGSTLGIGNVSLEHGGESRWHASHQAGRDVDIAFFARDGAGKPVDPRQMTRYAPGGAAADRGSRLVFDTERNLTLVRALLEEPESRVQWIFVAEWLKDLLLAEARSQRLSEDVVLRMTEALHQPGDSNPHDDHFHVRLHCSIEDRLYGCLDWGPLRAWVDHGEEPFASRCADLVRVLGTADLALRLEALDALAAIRGRPALPSLVAHLEDAERKVRSGALRAIRLIADPASIPGLVGALSRTTDVRWAATLFDTIRLVPDPASRELALSFLRDPGSFLHPKVAASDLAPLRITAARLLERWGESESVPPLLTLLDSPAPGVLRAAHQALLRVTNHVVAGDPASSREARRLAVREAWSRFWETHRDLPWVEWLREGLVAAGHAIEGPLAEPKAIEAVIEATADRRVLVAHNAVRLLSAVTGHAVDPAWRSPKANRRHWLGWWKETREASSRL